MPNTPAIEVKRLSKTYGEHRVLRRVSLVLPAGAHVAILGPSGCGKSTLLRLMAGLESPTEGEIWIDGELGSRAGRVLMPAHRRQLAMVFQDLALWPALTARDNVRFGLAGTRMSAAERRRRTEDALEICAIPELADRRPATLSGGQQQRVALARALAVRPRVLLLDEPFSALDLGVKTRLYGEIRRICATTALTLVVVAHDPLEALALCDRAAVLEDGAITEQGELETLLAAPTSATLRIFVEHVQAPAAGLAARGETPRRTENGDARG